jgi:hypothetical protein
MDKLEILEKKLHDSVKNFLDDIITILPNETLIVLAKIYISTQLTGYKLMKKFKKNILPIKDLVKNRNENFFLNGKYIDSLLDKYNIKLNFRDIWVKISPANKKLMWAWCDQFINITTEYSNLEKLKNINQAKLLLKF